MVSAEDIRRLIGEALPCQHLDVQGDGHHFEAVIVCGRFRGLSRLEQHQLVYGTLGGRMRQEIHALSMRTLTPEEWRQAHG